MGDVHNRGLLPCVALTAILLGFAGPAAAQQPTAPDTAANVAGNVVDGVTRAPIPFVLVRLLGTRTYALTDAYGVFHLGRVDPGPQLLSVRQYGYVDESVAISLPLAPGSYLDVSLVPTPLALEGFTIVADRLAIVEARLRGRRNAAAVTVQAISDQRLKQSTQQDALALLKAEAGLVPYACADTGHRGGVCLIRRGATSSPMVCIDDRLAMGGLTELEGFAPADLHLIEVYAAGAEIRAYSNSYIQALIRRPRAMTQAGGFGC